MLKTHSQQTQWEKASMTRIIFKKPSCWSFFQKGKKKWRNLYYFFSKSPQLYWTSFTKLWNKLECSINWQSTRTEIKQTTSTIRIEKVASVDNAMLGKKKLGWSNWYCRKKLPFPDTSLSFNVLCHNFFWKFSYNCYWNLIIEWNIMDWWKRPGGKVWWDDGTCMGIRKKGEELN